MKRSRKFWASLVAEYGRGKATVAEVAARHGVKPTTLSWWRWQLGREDKPRRRRRSRAETEIQLMPVELDLAMVEDRAGREARPQSRRIFRNGSG